METEEELVMMDFDATPVAQDAIRLDMYNDDIDGPTKGRYTEVLSLCRAMSLVIILIKAIEKAEVIAARGTGK